MRMTTPLLAFIFSLFSTSVMSYIAMATPIGPWIAPTITLLCMGLLHHVSRAQLTESVVLITAAGSVGGICATACGFSYPALFFLDQVLFTQWMHSPLYFSAIMTALVFVAGSFAMSFVNLFQERLINQDALPFPIGQLVYKMIAAGSQTKKAYELITGFVSTIVFCIAQDGMAGIKGFIPRAWVLTRGFNWSVFVVPRIKFALWPMLWAIGFVTGHVIAVPLAVGAVAKIILLDPINTVYFSELSSIEFVLAFATGMVVYGALLGFWSLRSIIRTGYMWVKSNGFRPSKSGLGKNYQTLAYAVALPVLLSCGLLSYLGMPFAAQLFLLAGAFGCTYQIAIIAGKIGLAPLGRFATFIMIPSMMLFTTSYLHLVVISTFVQIAGGVAADLLFGRKMAQLAQIDQRTVRRYQWFGLVVSSCGIGCIFWLLINRFGLGTPELFAYKAQSRSLLINAKAFNVAVLLLGMFFSAALKRYRINPMLVLGGLLMPINISLGLIFGGILSLACADKQEWEPLWSGVFAANSIWMILKSVI